MADDARLDRAERDIERLYARQDRTETTIADLRRDLRADLRDTEARLERRITESHDAVVAEIGKVEQHLEAQDEWLRDAFQRDDDLISARIDWPSWRNVGLGIVVIVAAYLALHFGFHVG